MGVCGPGGEHKGQGLLLRLGGAEGTVVLTCHHVVAAVEREDVRVRLPSPDGSLGEPVGAAYDGERSRPEQDAAVLRVREKETPPTTPTPLLHKLGVDTYEGSLEATVLTRLTPDNFDATVRPSTPIDIRADPGAGWPETPERYRVRAFRLASATYSRPGFSGGVVFCEGGVLGLAHFGRVENEHSAREDYLVPLSVWAEGWPALKDLIEPLVDGGLKGNAKVKRAAELDPETDMFVAGYLPDVYAEREADERARRALRERGGVVVVGRPLSGKSRLLVELLREDPQRVVVVPRPDATGPPGGFETSGFLGHEVVLLFDDLHRTARTSQPLAWRRAFEEATGRVCKVVCTTRDGADWQGFEEEQQHLLERLGKEEATVFVSRVEGPRHRTGEDLSGKQGWDLAQDLGIRVAEFERRFDGTPGSLLLDLDDMARRYERLRDEQRGGVPMSRLLDSAKLLHEARQPVVSHQLVRAVAESLRGVSPLDEETWEALIRRTSEEGFARLDEESGSISYYSPYLERCVDFEPRPNDFGGLQTLLEEHGDVLGLFYLVAVYGHALGDYERALSCAGKALELDPSLASCWYNKGYALDGLSRHEEALAAVERALDIDPNYHPAWYSKGWALSHLRRHEEAVEAHREALELARGSYQGAYLAGAISMYLDGLGAALAGAGRFYEAVLSGLRSLGLYPPYRPGAQRLCNLLCSAGEPAFALEVAERALSVDTEWPDAWYGKGMALHELGRRKEAVEAYDEATRRRPGFSAAWATKGTVLFQMSDFVRGSDDLARALTEAVSDAWARSLAERALDALSRGIGLRDEEYARQMTAAIVLSRLDRNDEAMEAFDLALTLEPRDARIHHNRGLCLVRMGRFDEALEAFGEATKLRPGLAPSWWSIVLLLSGHFDQQEAALYAVDHLIRTQPMDAEAWFAKGCILSKLGRPEEAGFWLRCARGQGGRHWLPRSPGRKRRSVLEFLGPESPAADERHVALGSRARGPFSSAEDPMQTMRRRFGRLSSERRDVLRALQLLAFANVGAFSRRRLRAVLESDLLFGREELDLRGDLTALAEQAFVDRPVSQDPIRPEFACLLHAVDYGGRHPSEDFDELGEVLEHRIADHEGLLALALVRGSQMQDWGKALTDIDRALRLEPEHARAWSNKSTALGHLERHAEALQAAEQARRLAPDHPNPSYNVGVALNQLGRHAEALAVFDGMAHSWPNDPRFLLGRAEALSELGREGEGAREAARAGSLHPNDPDLALREGLMLVGAGDHEGASSAADRALGLRPDDPLALFLKGAASMAASREAEAVGWFLRTWAVRHRLPDGGAMVAEMLRDLGHDPQAEKP